MDTQLQYVKGVGPKLASSLEKRGMYTVEDLFEYLPRAYEDRRAARNIASLSPGELVSIKAQVLGVSSQQLGRSRKKMYTVLLRDDSGKIAVKYFRVPYKGYFERFQTGEYVRVVGKVLDYRGRIEFHHADIQDWTEDESDALLPIYTEIDRLSPKRFRTIMENAFNALEVPIADKLPISIRNEKKLLDRHKAMKGIHFPEAGLGNDFFNYKTEYQRRIIFEELFWLELIMAARKKGVKKQRSVDFSSTDRLEKHFLSSLSFELTKAQKRSYSEIRKDLLSGHPMHRMLQGDVGCGKTMVAMLSACFVKDNNYQSCLMVPTEILAKQHYQNAKKTLEPLGLRVALLTGHMKASEKKEVYQKLQDGEIDLCVGTHALIQKDVHFKNLALVIIDEQHRFGVEQRNLLRIKGKNPHFLLMTATPIPRTLAMTVYGDLDVSIIDELPAGRVPILTRLVYESKRQKVMGFLRDQVKAGRQAYIVYPLVDESENMDLKDAMSSFESLQAQFPEIKFGLLHGKMKDTEKESVMDLFRRGDLQVLVSTTVIEVGVDVANANMMIIEHSERFGLSQLHQLRGRVGRGKHKSYCVLMLGPAVSEESRDRCNIMVEHSDGFKIAEADLEIRGPGVFMGTQQSGMPGFQMANLVRDIKILKEARELAFDLLDKDPSLSLPEHQILKEELLKTVGNKALAGVG
ncbi:MAG: ATP-dependent DNA helicase RecG [Bdellovibrionales bacterium]